MRMRVGLCLLAGMWGAAAMGQQDTQMKQRDVEEMKKEAAPPAPLKAPATLEPAHSPNANAVYQALRQRTVNGPAFNVKDVTIRRDAGVFTLSNGTVYLYGEVNGQVTGAVFIGEGTLDVTPPSAMERKQLKNVMKTEVLAQKFSSAMFAFTDGTAEELKKAAGTTVAGSGPAVGLGKEMQELFRVDLKYDLEERLLEDVAREGSAKGSGEFFVAVLKNGTFSKRLIYTVDPHGAIGVAPEEVGLLTSGDGGYDVTLGFGSEAQRGRQSALSNRAFSVPQQTIDVTIEHGGKLTASAVTLVTAKDNGVQILPLNLFPTLRVSGVWGTGGEALDFIQEDKKDDADLAVLLKQPLAAGESIQLTTKYSGKDAVLDMGGGNFFLVARENWYPNMRGDFGNYAQYTMTFHTPKEIQVVATGDRVTDKEDGKQRLSVWQSMAPMPVAGFNLGNFKVDESERGKGTQVVSYANTALADNYNGLANSGLMVGGLSTTGMLKQATSEGEAAIQIYTDFFGSLPYDHVSLTQQTACNFGQSWPTLVYLPICYFWDDTIKHEIGLDNDPTYWKVVTAHEVAHQWWGQTVGFSSYRDQWMSEGFADFSASLFLMETRKDMKDYRDFWALLRKRLLEKNAQGMRPIDAGSVVMGARVDTSKTGGVYQDLIYGKGAFILHMLQMLYWNPKEGNAQFKLAMHDFVNTYRNKAATTEEFKAAMEKDMPASADLNKNHKLNWFFDAWVYGTEIPKYTVTSEFSKQGDDTIVHFQVTQSGVSDQFQMLVPVYIETEDKRGIFIGRATVFGSTTVEKTVNLGKLPFVPKRIVVNYNYDLLSD